MLVLHPFHHPNGPVCHPSQQCVALPAVPLWCRSALPRAVSQPLASRAPHTHLVSLLRPHQRDSVVLAPQQRPQRIQPALREHGGSVRGSSTPHPHRGCPGHPEHLQYRSGTPLPWSLGSRAKAGLRPLQPLWCCSCPPGVPGEQSRLGASHTAQMAPHLGCVSGHHGFRAFWGSERSGRHLGRQQCPVSQLHLGYLEVLLTPKGKVFTDLPSACRQCLCSPGR